MAQIDARHGIELEAGEAGIEQGAFAGPEERHDRQIGFNKDLLRLVVKFHPFFTIQLLGSELEQLIVTGFFQRVLLLPLLAVNSFMKLSGSG